MMRLPEAHDSDPESRQGDFDADSAPTDAWATPARRHAPDDREWGDGRVASGNDGELDPGERGA
jgi:hypothetical protein